MMNYTVATERRVCRVIWGIYGLLISLQRSFPFAEHKMYVDDCNKWKLTTVVTDQRLSHQMTRRAVWLWYSNYAKTTQLTNLQLVWVKSIHLGFGLWTILFIFDHRPRWDFRSGIKWTAIEIGEGAIVTEQHTVQVLSSSAVFYI